MTIGDSIVTIPQFLKLAESKYAVQDSRPLALYSAIANASQKESYEKFTNPLVSFDISVGGQLAGALVMEVYIESW